MPISFKQSGASIVRRALFVALLIISLVILTVYSRETQEGTLHRLQLGVLDVVSPVRSAGEPARAVSDTVGSAIEDVSTDDATLSELREQNQQLRRLLSEADEYRQESERLADLLDMKKASQVDGFAVRVTGRSIEAWDRSLTIDAGTDDGVVSGMAVMGPGGVIGQVYRAGKSSATVRLLSDSNSGVAAMIQSSRAQCVVMGSLNGLLYLENIEEDQIPEVGDVVLTSGLGGSYPRGLVIGTVVSVSKTDGGSVGEIIVNPNGGDMSSYEEVFVVTGTASTSLLEPEEPDTQSGIAAADVKDVTAAERPDDSDIPEAVEEDSSGDDEDDEE